LHKHWFRSVGWSLIEEPKNEETSHPSGIAKSRIWGAETREPIATKFCLLGGIQDVNTPTNFFENRLRGFGVAKGRVLAYSIDLLRRL